MPFNRLLSPLSSSMYSQLITELSTNIPERSFFNTASIGTKCLTSSPTQMFYATMSWLLHEPVFNHVRPPVNLWNSSTSRFWFLSCDRIDRKIYPPMNSCTVLQSALSEENWTFPSSKSRITSRTSQLTCHDRRLS